MRWSVIVAALSLCVAQSCLANGALASLRARTDIPAEDLSAALNRLAEERGFQIVYVTEELSGHRTNGIKGDFTPEEALQQLLNGTGFTFHHLDERTVTVVPIAATLSISER